VALLRPLELHRGVDQPEVAERLRKVAEDLARARVELLAEQPQVVRAPASPVEQLLLSNRGKHAKSTAPSRATSAHDRRSPISPYSGDRPVWT
jgi:hypothetical protein